MSIADAYGHTPKPSTFIMCETASRRQEFVAIANACGLSIVDTDWRPDHGAPADTQSVADYLLAEILSVSENPAQSLDELAGYSRQHASQTLLWTDIGLLDAAYANLPFGRSHFLVEATSLDAIPILSGALRSMTGNRLYDRDRQTQFGALHKISNELAHFARTLAQMAEQDRAGVSDKPVSFRPAPPDAFQRFVTGTEKIDPQIDATMVRQIIKLRRLRDNYFDPSLFADPAWDILLDLMAAKLEGVRVSVSSLCIAAAVPATTALRWISTMTENGLLVREHDPDDARRIFIGLSEEVAASLHQYLTDIQRWQSAAI